MAQPPVELGAINFRRLFPWVDIFRAFALAFELRKLVIAGLAVFVVAAGNWLLRWLFLFSEPGTPIASPWERELSYTLSATSLRQAQALLDHPWSETAQIVSNWQVVVRPLRLFLDPVTVFFHQAAWTTLFCDILCLFWTLCVWGVCGGALIRLTAVEYARNEHLSWWAAVKFSLRHLPAYLCGPGLGLLGVAGLWTVCVLFGLAGRIPLVGEFLLGIGWFIPLLCGFLMALILVGLTVGWPLMFATVSIEQGDGFEALSRAYSYVYDRPWQYACLSVVALTFGSLVIFFVDCAGQLMLFLSAMSVGWGFGMERLPELFQLQPGLGLFEASGVLAPPDSISLEVVEIPAVSWGARLVSAWIFLVRLLIAGFVHSYFWAATTIIYFLLRRASDATDLDEVDLDEQGVREETDDLLALVRKAAPIMPFPEPAPTAKSESAISDPEAAPAATGSTARNPS